MTDILAGIQAQLKAPKDKENTFGKYMYRNAESILRAFKEVQPDSVSLTMSDEITLVGQKLFLVSTAILMAGNTEIARAQGVAMHATEKKGMDDAQISGACSSYARKYALCGLFAIDDSADDPDAKDNTQPPAPKRQEPKPAEPTRQAPQKNDAAVAAVVYLGGADTDDDLIARWRNLPDAVKDDQRVIDAGAKARKDIKLAAANAANPDLDGDHIPIPYEGK